MSENLVDYIANPEQEFATNHNFLRNKLGSTSSTGFDISLFNSTVAGDVLEKMERQIIWAQEHARMLPYIHYYVQTNKAFTKLNVLRQKNSSNYTRSGNRKQLK